MGQWCKETAAVSPFLPDNPALCYPRVCGAQSLGISYSILQTYFRRQRAPTTALTICPGSQIASPAKPPVGGMWPCPGRDRPQTKPLFSRLGGSGEWRVRQGGGAGKPKGENGKEPQRTTKLLLGHVKPQEKSWEPRASF